MRTPHTWYRIENAAAEVADVSIFDEISPWGVTAQDFVRELGGISAPRINLHLNTPGGDVFDGIAIYNALIDHPAEVTVWIPGLAASIGTVIAMAAHRVMIAPHAKMMIHEAWGGAVGDASDMAKMAERLEATSANIAAIYAERAGGDVEYWRARMKAETWYTDDQAVAAGLADGVGRSNDQAKASGKIAALFDLTRYRHGEREAAVLRADFEVVHACICGLSDCPLTHEEPAPADTSNLHVQEREALEAALASVPKGALLWH